MTRRSTARVHGSTTFCGVPRAEPASSIAAAAGDGGPDQTSAGQVAALTAQLDEARRMLEHERAGRERAEQRLEALKYRQQAMLDALPYLFWFKDIHGCYQVVNQAFCQFHGHGRDEMIGKPADELFAPERAASMRAGDRAVLEQGGNYRNEIRQSYAGSGVESGWVETTKGLVYDQQGALLGIIGTTQDITARKQAEEALTRANRELRQRLAELSALNQIAQAVTLWTELPDSLTAVRAIMTSLFEQASIDIWLLDGTRTTLTRLVAITNEQILTGAAVIAVADDPVVQQVIARARPKVFAPTARIPPIAAPPHLLVRGAAGGGMLLPLQSRSVTIGLLCIRAARPDGIYTPADVTLAQTIAGSLANAIDNARLFAQAQATAVEEERKRLARELHDSVSQTLFHANLTADILPQIWADDPHRGRRALGDLRHMTGSALAEMRTLLIELRPTALTGTPLADLLAPLVTVTRAKAGITVEATLEALPLLAPDVQVAIYRIAQEALHNVVKHARASQIAVELRAVPPVDERTQGWRGTVALRVADDGCGFDPARVAPGRLGLVSIQERAATIGATLQIASAPGAGTQISIAWQGAAVDTHRAR
jgi:PAS domain S-box-containing protein